MNRDIGKFRAYAREDDKSDTTNLDFSAQAFLEFFKNKVLKIVLAGQLSGESKEGTDQYHKGKYDHQSQSKTRHTIPFSSYVPVLIDILPDQPCEIYQLTDLQGISQRAASNVFVDFDYERRDL